MALFRHASQKDSTDEIHELRAEVNRLSVEVDLLRDLLGQLMPEFASEYQAAREAISNSNVDASHQSTNASKVTTLEKEEHAIGGRD